MPTNVEKTLASLAKPLAEIREIDRRTKEVDSLHDPIISGLEKILEKAKAAKARALRKFSNRRDLLVERVMRIVNTHRDDLLAAQTGKTIKVPGGSIVSLREQPEHIAYKPATEEEMIARVKVAGFAERFVRVREELDIEALEDAREIAEKLGFRFERNPEKIIIKP